MKLSVEAKVAAAVAAGFIAVTAAAIGQGGIDAQSSALNYGFSENLGVNTQIDAQAYSSLYDRSNAEVSREKFRDHDVTGPSRYEGQNRKIANTLRGNKLGRTNTHAR